MVNAMALIGFILIVFTFIFSLAAAPMMNQVVCTHSGCALENVSALEKTFYSMYDIVIAVIPILTFIVGIAFLVKGV